jgi:hypothetical protein
LLNDLWKFDGTRWIWVSGSSGSQALGSYGVRGTASPTNVPGARWRARLQGDFSGNLWLFGGMTVSGGQLAALDDLWKFNGTEWTWVAGSSTPGAPATYHAPGVSSASYTPGARFNAASWIDPAGAFWVFGGRTVGADGRESTLGDLWKHDGSGWAWVSGSSTANQAGVYGTLGVAAPQNTPGARANATACADPSGKVWLFGGEGILSSGVGPLSLNELWMFDGTRWTWVSGSNTAPQPAVYGTRGEAAPGNTPGARAGSSLWSDGQGGLWLFGGFGYGNAIGSPEDAGKSFFGNLNDLWKFDGTQWTWIGGHNYANQPGLYGTLGTPSSQNLPGARVPAGFWRDSSGKLWIFGGISQDASMQSGTLNDLWRYSP